MTQNQIIKFCYRVSKAYLECQNDKINSSLNSEELAIKITADLFHSNGKKSIVSQIDKSLATVEKEYLLFTEIRRRIDSIIVEV